MSEDRNKRVSCIIKLPKMMAIYLTTISFRAILNKKQERSSTIDKYYRQHYVDCIHKPQGWAVPNTFTNSHGNLDSSVRQWGCSFDTRILQSKLLQPTTVREHQTSTTGCFTLNSFHNKIGCGAHTQYTDLQTVSTHNSLVLTVIQLAAREQLRKCLILSQTKGARCSRIPEDSSQL